MRMWEYDFIIAKQTMLLKSGKGEKKSNTPQGPGAAEP